MALGILGGTFDPVHVAHLIAAETAVDELGLDSVVLIPAARPPHKEGESVSPFEDRLEMVRLAIADNPALEASDLEASRPGASYTIQTVREVRTRYAVDDLWFVMGADSLTQFLTWKDPEALLEECRFAVVPRPGVDPGDADPRVLGRTVMLDMPFVGVSATDIRSRVRAGRTIRYQVPASVESYIREKSLYS
ncbi:MAG: nicotinate-nucleotide adenylyltransferase [Candidatus Eisenbacteria bacterium]|nr:nicotinate-nucleotide adenylyltransferase [Candidatus Eisenbacteria bacterium]